MKCENDIVSLPLIAHTQNDFRLFSFLSVPFPCSLVKNDDCDGEKSPEDCKYTEL